MDDPKNPFQPDKVPSNTESVVVPGPAAVNPDGSLVQPSRQMMLDANSYRDKMPTTLMRRPGFGTAGKAIGLQLNSHRISTLPSDRYYQYDVSQTSSWLGQCLRPRVMCTDT